MFRSNQYCSRYEETPIQLDTAITIPRIRIMGYKKKMDRNLQLMIEVHILIALMDSLKLNLLLIN